MTWRRLIRSAKYPPTGLRNAYTHLNEPSTRPQFALLWMSGMSVIIELKRGAQPRKVLNQLFKYTALQSTFGVQLLALVADPLTKPGESGPSEPRLLSLKRALQIYIEHRRVVITRRTQRETYAGPLVVGNDLMLFDVRTNGVSYREGKP